MIFISLVTTLACFFKNNTAENPLCDEERTEIASDQPSIVGFIPQETAERDSIADTIGLEWEDETLGCLEVSLVLDPNASRDVYVTEVEAETDGPLYSEGLGYVECNNYLEIDGTFSFQTPGGEINEENIAITMTYEIDSYGYTYIGFHQQLNQLSGTFIPSNADETAEYYVDGKIVDGELKGHLVMQTYSENSTSSEIDYTYFATWGDVEAPAECASVVE